MSGKRDDQPNTLPAERGLSLLEAWDEWGPLEWLGEEQALGYEHPMRPPHNAPREEVDNYHKHSSDISSRWGAFYAARSAWFLKKYSSGELIFSGIAAEGGFEARRKNVPYVPDLINLIYFDINANRIELQNGGGSIYDIQVRQAADAESVANPPQPPEKQPSRRGGGAKPKYDWPEIERQLLEKLRTEGALLGRGDQADLERWAANRFPSEQTPSASLIREHVTKVMNRYHAEVDKAGN